MRPDRLTTGAPPDPVGTTRDGGEASATGDGAGNDDGHPAGWPSSYGASGQKLALSPQAQPPDALGFSIENPDASRLSFQSMTAPCM